MSENVEKMNILQLLEFFRDNMMANINAIHIRIFEPKSSDFELSVNWYLNNWMKQFDGYIEKIKKRVIK